MRNKKDNYFISHANNALNQFSNHPSDKKADHYTCRKKFKILENIKQKKGVAMVTHTKKKQQHRTSYSGTCRIDETIFLRSQFFRVVFRNLLYVYTTTVVYFLRCQLC